ncbi:MAG TPA: hypothetical protein VF322_11580 [Gammaproteobacteria bacterium]
MALTDNCDLFAAVHEDGVNRVIRHLMLQRPSLFNYASPGIANNRDLWCEPVEYTEDVVKYGNPLFTELPPLPVIGADSPPVTLDFCVQVVRAQIDFHPGKTISLPPQLSPPLGEQRFALYFRVCGGVACPSERELGTIPVLAPKKPVAAVADVRQPIPPVHVRGRPQCFCLDAYVVGHFAREVIGGRECLVGKVDGIELVDIAPAGLEANLECYIRTAVTLVLRQKLAIPLATFFIELPLFGLGTVTLGPTPNPPVPHNPAVEDDQLKAFISMS